MPLSPEVRDAVNHVKSHAQQLRAILTLADAVDDVAKLEALAGEADARRVKAEKAAERADNHHDKMVEKSSELAKEVAAAEKAVGEAQKQVRDILSQAEIDANNTKSAAAIEAKALIDAAQVKVDEMLAGQDEQIAAKQADIDTLDAAIKVKTSEADDLDKRVAKAKNYLDRVASVE